MIRHWVVLDLDVFRRFENDSGVRYEILDNRDGTYFVAYDLRSFPSELIVAKSPTMALALEQGVHSVEPLKREEITPPPFHGRCRCGAPGLYFAANRWFCNIHRDEMWVLT
jgi:hypothetical protein